MARVGIALTCLALFPVVGSLWAQSLDIAVSSAQYTTYVKVSSGGTVDHPVPAPPPRTTVSSSPFTDEIYLPMPPHYAFYAYWAIASAGLFEASDQTVGSANALAISQLWFSPVVDQTQTLGLHIGGMNFTAFEFSLLDVTAGSNVWNCFYSLYTGGFPSGTFPGITNVVVTPWPFPGNGGTISFGTSFLASDEYELTLATMSSAGGDAETPWVQLTGLEAVPEPSTWVLVGAGVSVVLSLARRRAQATTARKQQGSQKRSCNSLVCM
ncbi:MAG TPA: PEP-CTERM sorting domain-containing protein [Verrucomicrobiae bacterium]|nr:PEP-CTERM sorting domain-containing protein [Verrucomicrobiae bacterium]